MEVHKETYNKCGEVYLLDINNYTILCYHCNEIFDEFDEFRNHTLIHVEEHEELIEDVEVEDNVKSKFMDRFNSNSLLDVMETEDIDGLILDEEIQSENSDDKNIEDEEEVTSQNKDCLEFENQENLEEILDEEIQSEISDDKNIEDEEEFTSQNNVCLKFEDQVKLEEIFCPHCKIFFKCHKHDLEKCLEVQNKISSCNGDFDKLSNEGIYVCKNCPRYFTHRLELYDHNMKEKYKEKEKADKNLIFESSLLQCQYCIKKFKLKLNLDKHEQLHKADELKCKSCEKTFPSLFKMNVHMRMHTDDRPFKCEFCSASFTLNSYLKNHIIYKHTDKRPFKCKFESCSATFKLLTLKKEHEKRHLPSKIQCEICGIDYKTRSSLLTHQISKHVDRNQWPYQCDICEKRFSQKRALADHERIHTGERPFKCDICPSSFKKKSNLREHKKTHNKTEKHPCIVCGKIFPQFTALKNHTKRHLEISTKRNVVSEN